MQNPELWERLKAFRFDAPSVEAPFSVKLAREEGWSETLTEEVIEEYRRFIYLTQITPDHLTPSEPVDRAWHMHMTFTRSYWEDLCDGVLGRKLHHEPCAGLDEMPRYGAQYRRTLALYEAEFGRAPPVKTWRRDTRVSVLSLLAPPVLAMVAAILLKLIGWGQLATLSILVAIVLAVRAVLVGASGRWRRRRGRLELEIEGDGGGCGD